MYDYLAEEVVGDLPEDIQDFLMRASLLEAVDEALAARATGLSTSETRSQIHQLERLGLLGRRGESRESHRFHPLVREFLQHRLRRTVGDEEVRELHLRIARGANRDWKTAAHHYAEAKEANGVHTALEAATLQIMGSGDYLLAASYLERFPPVVRIPKYEVFKSRVDFRRGDLAAGMARAREAHTEAPDSDDGLANLIAFELMVGDIGAAVELAKELERRTTDPELAGIATATVAMIESSLDLDLETALRRLDALADRQRDAGHTHYQGISLLNSSSVARVLGDAEGALARASQAIALLEASSGGSEVAGAQLNRGWALLHLGRSRDGLAELAKAIASGHSLARAESLIDAALVQALYGSSEDSYRYLQEAEPLLGTAPHLQQDWLIASAQQALRAAATDTARAYVDRFEFGKLTSTPGRHLHQLVVAAHLAAISGGSAESIDQGLELAAHQNSALYREYLTLLKHFAGKAGPWDRAVARALESSPVHATILAELVADRLDDLSLETFEELGKEAGRRPVRWQPVLRTVVDQAGPSRMRAARLLDEIGAYEDIRRLRALAKGNRAEALLGKRLARRLAPRVVVEDQGRVSISVGSRVVAGTQVRRKVLAALCFLLSRPDFSATRDQIVDALWPDLDPAVALNSLNQTAYFLRRVFEPDYKEDFSPEYLHHASDVLWLDTELVSARSADCWALVRIASSDEAPEHILRLSETYLGRFALDFAYEEWAAAYRDGLHASYLQLIEAAVTADMATGHFDRAIRLARRALEVDPEAEQLELSLLRLYRQSGAHAAAAEQYGHYAAAIRGELGIDPVPLEAL